MSLNRNNNKCAHIIQTQAKNYVKYYSSKYGMNKYTFHQLLSIPSNIAIEMTYPHHLLCIVM